MSCKKKYFIRSPKEKIYLTIKKLKDLALVKNKRKIVKNIPDAVSLFRQLKKNSNRVYTKLTNLEKLYENIQKKQGLLKIKENKLLANIAKILETSEYYITRRTQISKIFLNKGLKEQEEFLKKRKS